MRWTPGGMSSDIDDERGSSGGGGFGFGRAPMGIGGAIILLVLSLIFKRNFFALVGGGETAPQRPGVTQPVQESGQEHHDAQLVSFVLDDVQSTWDRILPDQAQVAYKHSRLTLFRDAINTGCGQASAASGPFYCPADDRVYIDLGFYDDLRTRFGAPGDFAEAYVIAHEIGHHVQDLLGISDKVERAMHDEPQNANSYSVRLELQADCFAGVWGNSTSQRNIIDQADVDAGLAAAAAVGDDRIQKMSGRRVNPETWTHGSAEERTTWFKRGLQSGRISDCNTFR